MYLNSPYKEVRGRKEAEVTKTSLTGITDYIMLKGKIVEQNRHELYPKYMSRVVSVSVDRGDTVNKGDILMTLEVSDDSSAAPTFYAELKSKGEALDIGGINAGLPQPSGGMTGERYYIISPINGMVMEIYSKAGETVSGIFPCIAVSDMSALGVSAEIGEAGISKIQKGLECKISVPSLSDKTYLGEIESIAPYATSASLFAQKAEVKTELTASIKSPDAALRPGYTAEMKVVLGYDKSRIVVPYKCVAQDESGEYVMTVGSDLTLTKTAVKTGRELEGGIEIISGVKAGCYIVNNPDSYVSGEKVKLK